MVQQLFPGLLVEDESQGHDVGSCHRCSFSLECKMDRRKPVPWVGAIRFLVLSGVEDGPLPGPQTGLLPGGPAYLRFSVTRTVDCARPLTGPTIPQF